MFKGLRRMLGGKDDKSTTSDATPVVDITSTPMPSVAQVLEDVADKLSLGNSTQVTGQLATGRNKDGRIEVLVELGAGLGSEYQLWEMHQDGRRMRKLSEGANKDAALAGRLRGKTRSFERLEDDSLIHQLVQHGYRAHKD